MQLNELKAPAGSNKRKKIVGRGRGSGFGKTSGTGENGQKSRSGRGIMRGSEGGQIALIRRIPKMGFRSHRPLYYKIVQLESLKRFKEGSVIDAKFLLDHKLIKNAFKPYKILGVGEIKKPLTLKAYSFSKSAREKIKNAGGKAEIITTEDLIKEFKTQKR